MIRDSAKTNPTLSLANINKTKEPKEEQEQELENIFIVLSDFAIDLYLASRKNLELPILPIQEKGKISRRGGEKV